MVLELFRFGVESCVDSKSIVVYSAEIVSRSQSNVGTVQWRSCVNLITAFWIARGSDLVKYVALETLL